MNTFTKTVIAAFAALIMVLVPIVITDDGGDAAPSGNVPEEYEVWSTPIWSYTLEYAYRGQYVTEIPIWDFDDGTEPVQSWSGKHTYTDVGTYYIKQTSTNNVTSINAYFQVQIMGFPYITLVYNNGEDNATIETERYADPASLYKPEADPERTGYDFTGWYTDENCTEAFDWEIEVEEPITLYAGWDAIEYTVHFDLGEVEGTAPQDQKVDYGKLIQQPENPVDSSEDARTFLGWYFEDALWSFTSPVEGDMTLVAHWSEPGVEYVTVTFDGNGGTAGQSTIPAEIGQEIELPSATRDGFTFDGWFDGDEKVGDAGDKYTVEAAVTLTAHWTEVTTPGEDDDEDDGNEDNFWFLVGAIVCGVLAVICLALGPRTNWYSIIGTAVLVIVAAVCLLFYFEVM